MKQIPPLLVRPAWLRSPSDSGNRRVIAAIRHLIRRWARCADAR
jgi:hypothetical protein